MTERQWQMRRLASGDYLLPANSTEHTNRVFRIYKWLDGPHLGVSSNRVVWSLFEGYTPELDYLSLELAPWDMPEWKLVDEYPTRNAAIAASVHHDDELSHVPSDSHPG